MYVINDGLAVVINKMELKLTNSINNNPNEYFGLIWVNDIIKIKTGEISLDSAVNGRTLCEIVGIACSVGVEDRILYDVISYIEMSDLKCISAVELSKVFQKTIVEHIGSYIQSYR